MPLAPEGLLWVCGAEPEGEVVSGVLVRKDYQYTLVDPEEISEFTELQTTVLKQQHTLAFSAQFSLLKFHLEQMFGTLDEETTVDGTIKMMVRNS